MDTLNLSDSAMGSENRLKSLFWPSIQSASDVDYLGAQGYWVCAVVAAVSMVFLASSRHPVIGAIVMLFYYLGGVGVRERSRYAATVVLVMYVTDTIFAGMALLSVPGIVRIFLTGLLLSNFRATWMASRWTAESSEVALPPRFGDTWGDKFADQLPMWLWPKIRVLYYVLSVCYLLLAALGLMTLIVHRRS